MPSRRGHLHEPLTVPGRLHANQSRPRQSTVKLFCFCRCVLQLLLSRLTCNRVQPTNLLPTRVIITSNKHHRRLLPTESFGPPTRSLLGYRTEPSFLSNQSCPSLARLVRLSGPCLDTGASRHPGTSSRAD